MKTKGVQKTADGSRAVLDLRLVRRVDRGGKVHANLYPLHAIIDSYLEKIRLSIYNL